MSLAGPTASEVARERQALKARISLGVKMLTNAGYAMIGGTVFKAIVDQRPIPPLSYLWSGAGVAALLIALWLAPHGEAGD